MTRKPEHADGKKAMAERSGLRTPIIYEIVRKRSDEEMARPAVSPAS